MIVLLAALALSGGLAAPHLVHLDAAPPVVGAVIWSCALLLRAATTILVIAFLILAVPAGGVYAALSQWCWHAILPLLTTHLGLSGHAVADAALLFPAVVLAASAASVAVALVRATRRVRRLLAGAGLGAGPSDSVIIGDGVIVVAAAGLRRPRVIVSAGALARLDDAELRASLEHERGHIDRRHRWFLAAGEVARALGRFVPGSRTALAELAYHLERDADRYALARDHQPRVLARAICKAAQGGPWAAAPATALGGPGVVRRVSQLVGESPTSCSPVVPRLLATALAALVLVVLAAAPPAALAAMGSGQTSAPALTCPR